MSDKKPLILFENPQKGIAISPHFGIADMRNIDIWSEPGVARVAWQSIKKSADIITRTPRFTVQDTFDTSKVYFLDNSNRVYRTDYGEINYTDITGSRITSNGSGDGLVYWKRHLFAFRDTQIDVYNIATGTWFNNWGGYTLDSGRGAAGLAGYHPALWSLNDDRLYIGHGSKIMRVTEVGTFDAGNSGTWTADVNTDGNVSDGYRIKCLRELGENLMIGTWRGVGIADSRTAVIFPWDRSSTSFDTPIQIKENGINQMVVDNNELYIQAGIFGNWYATNGSYTRRIPSGRKSTLPKHIFDFEAGRYLRCEPDAVFIRDGKIYFGVSVGSTGFDDAPQTTAATLMNPLGVWSIDIETGAMVFENQISTQNTANVNIGTLFPVSSDTYTIGWHDVTKNEQGVDLVGNSARYPTNTNGSRPAFMDSELVLIGTLKDRRAFTETELILSQPLHANEAVRLLYRRNTEDAFQDLGVISSNDVKDISIVDLTQIQVRAELIGSGEDGPHMKGLILR